MNNKLVVTDVKLKITEKNGVKATGSIILNDAFAINSIRIVETPQGKLIVAMPSHKTVNGFKDLCHPTNKETRELIENAVLSEYNRMTTLNCDFLVGLA